MADDDEDAARGPTWRVTGRRRWLHLLVTITFVVQALARLFSVLFEPPPHLADWVLLVLATIGSATAVLLVVRLRRTRVTLIPDAIEVHTFRTRLVRYADVVRARRDRVNRAAVTLDLVDGTRTVLPAPVAGLRDPAPELDEAVDLINARVATSRPQVEDGRPG